MPMISVIMIWSIPWLNLVLCTSIWSGRQSPNIPQTTVNTKVKLNFMETCYFKISRESYEVLWWQREKRLENKVAVVQCVLCFIPL